MNFNKVTFAFRLSNIISSVFPYLKGQTPSGTSFMQLPLILTALNSYFKLSDCT